MLVRWPDVHAPRFRDKQVSPLSNILEWLFLELLSRGSNFLFFVMGKAVTGFSIINVSAALQAISGGHRGIM